MGYLQVPHNNIKQDTVYKKKTMLNVLSKADRMHGSLYHMMSSDQNNIHITKSSDLL